MKMIILVVMCENNTSTKHIYQQQKKIRILKYGPLKKPKHDIISTFRHMICR